MATRQMYRVTWAWFDGEESKSVRFTRRREAEQSANRFRKVAKINPDTVKVITEPYRRGLLELPF